MASMEAAVHTTAPEEGDELRTSHQLPLASLSFAEIHKALGKVHVVSSIFWVVRSPPNPRGSTWDEGASRGSFYTWTVVIVYVRPSPAQAEVKRLTALVEEAAKKNRKLIALGSKLLLSSSPFGFFMRMYVDLFSSPPVFCSRGAGEGACRGP
jgi:hypothetical protein